MTEKINYAQLISKDHKFSIVDTVGRDTQQALGWPIQNFNDLIETMKYSAQAGFNLEAGGGDLTMTMLRMNQNPIRHQKKIKEAIEGTKAKTQLLVRNYCVNGYKHQAASDLEFVTTNLTENFDIGRVFAHSNSTSSMYPVAEVLNKNGKQAQWEYSPSYVDGKSVWSDERVIEHFQTGANLGHRNFGFKIFDGAMPPEDIYRIMSKLKQPGVMPEGCVFACHTHDGHGLAETQYEAFIAAGGNEIHCTHPAFASSNTQPAVSYFVKKYSSQIENFSFPEFSEYLVSGYELAKKNNVSGKNLKDQFRKHAEIFVKRIHEKEPDYYKELFGKKDIDSAIEKYTKELVQRHRESTCPGGGYQSTYDRATKAGWVGENVIPMFAKRDFLMDYFITLKKIKPKIGGNGYVTPNFKNADELALTLTKDPNVKDPFTSPSGVSIVTRKIFQGEFDPPMGALDKEWLALIKSQDFDKELTNLKDSFALKNTGVYYELKAVKQSIIQASEAINDSYRTVRDYELLHKQMDSLATLYTNKKIDKEYYSNQSKILAKKLKDMGEKMEGSILVTHQDYIDLNKRGKDGGKLSESIVKIIDSIPELKPRSDDSKENFGKLLRSVTFLECPAADVVLPKLEVSKQEYHGFITEAKLEEGKHLYPQVDAVVFRMLSHDEDPASPKRDQCFAGGSQALLAQKFADMEAILKTSKEYKAFVTFNTKDGAAGIRRVLGEHGYGTEQSGTYSQKRLDEFVETRFAGFASKDIIKYSGRYITDVMLPNLDVEKITGISRLAGRNMEKRKIVEAKMKNPSVKDIWKQFKGIVSEFSDIMLSMVTETANKKQITQHIENMLTDPEIKEQYAKTIAGFYNYTSWTQRPEVLNKDGNSVGKTN